MLASRWTPFAVRSVFPTAIDYYGVLRPPAATSDAAIPALTTCRGRPHGFPRSVGVSLPGLRRHLYPGGPVRPGCTSIPADYAYPRTPFQSPRLGSASSPAPSLSFPGRLPLTRRHQWFVTSPYPGAASRSHRVIGCLGYTYFSLGASDGLLLIVHRLSDWLQGHEVGPAMSLMGHTAFIVRGQLSHQQQGMPLC